MARLNGHLSEKLYNEELYNLYQILKNINYTGLSMPDPTHAGALWRDNNELKYAYNNQWNSLFSDKFKITSNLTSTTLPDNPVYGQLWIDNGTLKFFNGTEFVVVKSEATEQPFNSFSFYNFLQIHNLEPYGKNFTSEVNNASHYSASISESDWIYNADLNTYYYNISQAEYGLKTDFTYTIQEELYDGVDSFILQELDDSDYQLAISGSGTITIYSPSPVRCTINLLGTQANESANNTRIDTYLVPNAEEDRVFLDGLETQEHKYINDVTFSLDSDLSSNKKVSLVHVNSDYLSNIAENIFLVNRDNPYINIREEVDNTYTEYYIFNTNAGVIQLLNKHEYSPDYVSIPKGIVLTTAAIEKYFSDAHPNTFVVTFTYEFQSYKTKGELIKDSNTIYDVESGIYINTDTPVEHSVLFIDSDYQTDYSINIENNNQLLHIPDYTGEHFLSLLRVPLKIQNTSPDYYDDGIMYIPSHLITNNSFLMPAVHINNNIYLLDDFIYDTANDCYRTDFSNETAFQYDIIDLGELYVSSGIVSSSNCIKCSFEDLADGTDYIVINNHKLYNKNSLVRNADTGDIYGSSIYENDNYILIKNVSDSFLIRNTIASSQIYLDRFDNAIVYIDGSLVLNANQVNLTDRVYNGQIVKSGSDFHLYNKDSETTEIINDTYILDALSRALTQYSSDHNSISFESSDSTGKKYSIYAYRYGNSVEKPLITGELDGIEGTDISYNLLDGHQYSVNTNSLSIYVNGIRQYPDEFEETSPVSFTLHNSTASKILYVIEPIEGSEYRSYQTVILTDADKIEGYANTYRVSVSLSSGFLKLYKNGVRLNYTEYEVKNPSTLYINGVEDGDTFLLEINGDYLLRELTVPIKFDQTKWIVGDSNVDYNGIPGDNIPEALIGSKDTIMIYINGLCYGTSESYITNSTQNPKYIQLSNAAKDLLDHNNSDNGYITFEWR